MTDEAAYVERLAAEAEFWGRDAEHRAREVPPNWHHQRHLRHNAFGLGPEIDARLTCVHPGMRRLESSGRSTRGSERCGPQSRVLDVGCAGVP